MPDSEHLTAGARFTPQAMIRAVGAVVHESVKPEDAYQQYLCPPAPAG
jgi:hypothetical protein